MKIAVIRNDGIGDLLLFNFFFSKLNFDSNDTIDFYLNCSSDFLNYFPFKNTKIRYFKFRRSARLNFFINLIFVIQILRLNFCKYNFIIIPVSSKNFYLYKYMSFITNKNLILFKDDNINFKSSMSNLKYNYEFKTNTYSEFKKNQEFVRYVSNILNKDLIFPKQINFFGNIDNIVIAPFASDIKRTWELKNWIIILEYLNTLKLPISFIGTKKQFELFSNSLGFNFCININVLTNSKSVLSVLNINSLFIGMDSAPAHISCLNNVRTIVISNANHYARFFPYSLNEKSSQNISTFLILPDELYSISDEILIETTKISSSYSINAISPNSVVSKINLVINDINNNSNI
jgi:ADP-heptose:LPS heptosyltransferase